MPPVNDLMSIIIIILIFIIAVIWLITNIRTISYEKRIENHVIIKETDEDLSLLGKIEAFYQKMVLKLVSYLKKSRLVTFKNISDIEKLDNLKLLSNKIIISIISLITYLVICLLTKYNFDVTSSIVFILIGYLIPGINNRIYIVYRNKKIENDLPKAISIMNNSFKAGKSIIQAIEIVKNELDGPISEEFYRVETDLLHGLSLELAFIRFKERVAIDDINYITTSLVILNQTGGNISSVFASIEDSYYTRKKLESELNATISSSKLVFYILSFLPLILWLMIGLWNQNYFTIFFTSQIGMILFLIIVSLYLLYIILIKNIMKVEKY